MITSKILSETGGSSIEQLSLHEEVWQSFLYGMLEFNDRMHEIEVYGAINDYRMLKEDAINEANNVMLTVKECEALQEASGKSIKERIVAAFQAIIDFIKKFINMITQKDTKTRNRYNYTKRKTSKFVNKEKINETYTFQVFHGPSLNDIDDNKCRAALNNITAQIDRICRGEHDSNVTDTSLAVAYKALSRIVRTNDSRREYSAPIENSRAFAEFVKTDILYKERVSMSYREWQASIADIVPVDKSIVAKKLSNIKQDLENCQAKVNKAPIVDPETKKAADVYISQIRAIVSSYSWFLNAVYDMETYKLNYIMNTYNKIRGGSFSDDTVMEYGMIHGEPFDSETLFGNEDLKDFNSTEWVNLGLTTEAFTLKYELDESLRRVALKEADIMSDDQFNKIQRLIAMREAEGEKAAGGIAGVFANIKRIITEFFNKLKGKAANNSKFFQRNKQFLDKEFKIEKVVSKGDILAGVARLQKSVTIVPFNYDSMKEDLKDKNTFFEKHILPTLKDPSPVAKRKATWDSNMSITEYCKCYFGASMGDDKYKPCEFTKEELNTNKQALTAFLNDPKVLQSINADITKIETESKKVASTTAKPSSDQKSDDKGAGDSAKPEGNNATAKQESYFSVLYNRYITEAEITMSADAEGKPGDNKSEGEGKPAGNDQAAALKVYVDSYKDVLLSKLTAAEFIISEGMAIMMAHAKSHMNAEQQKAESDITKNQTQA